VNKTGKIYDFFVEAGWIQNSDAWAAPSKEKAE
jgi:hypothetical protein